jgi:hypothetical protein
MLRGRAGSRPSMSEDIVQLEHLDAIMPRASGFLHLLVGPTLGV